MRVKHYVKSQCKATFLIPATLCSVCLIVDALKRENCVAYLNNSQLDGIVLLFFVYILTFIDLLR